MKALCNTFIDSVGPECGLRRSTSPSTGAAARLSQPHAERFGELTTDDVLMAVSVPLVVIGLREPDLSLLTLLPRVRPLDVGLSRDAAPNTGP